MQCNTLHKWYYSLTGTLILFVLMYSVGYGECWKVKSVISSFNQPVDARAISFCDSINGLVVGMNGLVARTTDGGLTWYDYSLTPADSHYDVTMFDSLKAILISSSTTNPIKKTTNGGKTWVAFSGLSENSLKAVTFVTRNKGIAVGDYGVILQTSDGGEHWTKAIIGTNAHNFRAVTYIDSVQIVVVGTPEIIFRSRDGGKTWSEEFSPTIYAGYNFVSFSDTSHGLIGSNGGGIARTSDGGKTWRNETIPSISDIMKIRFYDKAHCIAVGTEGLAYSSDTGRTWSSRRFFHGNYFDIVSLTGNEKIMIGQGGNIISSKTSSCESALALIYPLDASEHIPLHNEQNEPFSVRLTWNFEFLATIGASRVQVGLDSTLSTGLITDTTIEVSISSKNAFLSQNNLKPKTTYYWRVSLLFTDSTETNRSEVYRFTTAGGSIRGFVYHDTDVDSTFDNDETRVAGVTVLLTENNDQKAGTDSMGEFLFTGLDSGSYLVTFVPPPPWESSKSTMQQRVILGLNDSVNGIEFGQYYPWADISGKVFYDVNENGVRDSNETGMHDWTLELRSETFDSVVQTNEVGEFRFGYLENLSCSVFVRSPVGWEKITPRLVDAYKFENIQLGQQYRNVNFAVHPIPPRIKIVLSFHESSNRFIQKLSLGVRDGATFGIWDADTASTNIDFSEGEAELPTQFDFIVDARFVNPHNSESQFGKGSWVDIRPYYSASQVDTYKVSFTASNGEQNFYPVIFRWSKEEIRKYYSGSAIARVPVMADVDMKLVDSIRIDDPSIHFMRIFVSHPVESFLDVPIEREGIPSSMKLQQNYPNPFNPVTVLSFVLSHSSLVTLKVYDLLGKEVASIYDNKEIAVGAHEVNFDASLLPSGVYFYRLNAGDFSSVRKMVLVR